MKKILSVIVIASAAMFSSLSTFAIGPINPIGHCYTLPKCVKTKTNDPVKNGCTYDPAKKMFYVTKSRRRCGMDGGTWAR